MPAVREESLRVRRSGGWVAPPDELFTVKTFAFAKKGANAPRRLARRPGIAQGGGSEA